MAGQMQSPSNPNSQATPAIHIPTLYQAVQNNQLSDVDMAIAAQQALVNPEDLSEEEALAILAEFLTPVLGGSITADKPNICDWGECFYYLAPGSSTESMARIAMPIRLYPHQKAILNFAFHHPFYRWTTILFSTVKKSGKTAIGGMVARYFAENSGFYAEVYCLANDEEQARGRIYKAATDSIESSPGWNRDRRILVRDGHTQWRIVDREAQYTPTHSFMRALSNDFRGESGANPTATVWSEIWGLTGEKSKRFWAELTPVPTRPSIRFVETYAGFEGESDILEEVWNRCQKEGRQITKDEMPDWPWDEDPPIWINEEAKTMGYLHQGEKARVMPWQTPDYYIQQAHELRADPVSFNRFHNNYWGSTVSELFPIEWYFACDVRRYPATVQDRKGNEFVIQGKLPPIRRNQRMVLAIDASTNRDWCAAVLVSREGRHQIAIRDARVWKPPVGGSINHKATIEAYIRYCALKYNIIECCYDPYQMHKLATDLEQEKVVNMFKFEQGASRMVADEALIQLFADRDIIYDTIFYDDSDATHDEPGSSEGDILEYGIRTCGKQQSKTEDTKLRIIKRGAKSHIDVVVALAMASNRCLELNTMPSMHDFAGDLRADYGIAIPGTPAGTLPSGIVLPGQSARERAALAMYGRTHRGTH